MSTFVSEMRCTGFTEQANNEQEITLIAVSSPSVTLTIAVKNPQDAAIEYNKLYRVTLDELPAIENPAGTEAS
jgi:hypothetical protein